MLTPNAVAGGKFNKITNLNWKLNIDLRKDLNGVKIYKVNSLLLNHRSTSRWYEPIDGNAKFSPTDYLRIGY